jgi:hypothetical protein
LLRSAELGFELVGLVEVVLDRTLVAAGDEHHVGDACGGRLLHRVLDQRLVDDRQHLLGARLGDREETAAETGNRENGFGDLAHRGPEGWWSSRGRGEQLPQSVLV